MDFCRTTDTGVIIDIRVQPKASGNAIAGIHDKALKIRITAPPVDGEANKLLIKFLAKKLRMAPSSLEILKGETGRSKQILIREPDPANRDRILQDLCKLVS
ncbi:MAG: DUF167 family protein [Pseudomonadota bacterium]